MDIKSIIAKKQNNGQLTFSELYYVVENYVCDKITKIEMSNFLQSCVFYGLSDEETINLTTIMKNSGKIINLDEFEKTIDKHSTGAVSDSTSLIVAPLFALFGYTCIKMSGKGLLHTGGTADKIKVFEGLDNGMSIEKAKQILKKTGLCFLTSTDEIAPADKKIYKLRNEINAMSLPLIASSIMSKKLACGAKNLILDIKYGNGAFITSKKQALKLAKLMQKIGKQNNVNTMFVLGDANQPLGNCIGDKLEVLEVMEILRTAKQTRLLDHSLKIIATAISQLEQENYDKVLKQAYEFVKCGKVFEKLRQVVLLQGGDFDIFSKKISPTYVVNAKKSGIITSIQTKKLGQLEKMYKHENNYFGFKILKEIGEKILKGEKLFELYFESENFLEIEKQLQKTIRIKNEI